MSTFDADKAAVGSLFCFQLLSSTNRSVLVLQVVASALDAARHRRKRLQDVAGSAPKTPSVKGGVKRDLPKKPEPQSASTTASSGVPSEKVTPDPKQAKVSGLPSPRALFADESSEPAQGGFCKGDMLRLSGAGGLVRGMSSETTLTASEDDLADEPGLDVP